MNLYEKKFKECYNRLKSNIRNDEENIERDTKEFEALVNLEKSFVELKNSGYENNLILDTLYKTVRENEKRLRCLESCIENRKRIQQEHRDKLSFLGDYLCPHEETEFHSEDYHKGVDIFECKLCGKLV